MNKQPKTLDHSNECNRAVGKLSPFKTLSPEQLTLKNRIEGFCRAHAKEQTPSLFLIYGGAGTGKSVVLSTVFNDIQRASRAGGAADPLYQTNNRLIVNHAEMIKLYKEIAGELPHLRKKDIERPTTFINQMQKQDQRADIVLIDEAHLLLTKSDKYNRFYQENQLEEIVKRSRVVVMVFDDRQVLKLKSYWNQERLKALISRFPGETFYLKQQFRMQANEAVRQWIDRFVHKKLLPLPEDPAFDLRIFDDAGALYAKIRQKNDQVGLSRMLATYDYPYKLDGKDYFIHEKNFMLRWDRSKPTEQEAWAERGDTIDEVGSVYTIQGFDLNYAGVILGPSVSYDEPNNRIVIHSDRYEDQAAFVNRTDIGDVDPIKEQIILNSINVLMTRGVHGLYIYASDPKLRQKLADLSQKKQ